MKLLYGSENYLINQTLEKIATNLPKGQTFVVFDEQDTLDKIIMEINNFSLFDTQKNIIIKNHSLLSKEKESNLFFEATKKELAKINVIFVWESNLLPKNKLINFIQKHGKITEFKELKAKAINALIKDLVQAKQGTISNRAILLLSAKLPNNLWIITNEVTKMLNQNLHIDEKMVDKAIVPYLADDYFALTNAIIDGDTHQIIGSYQEKMNHNILPTIIIQQIASVFILAKNVFHLQQNNLSKQQIATKLKIHPFRIQKAISMIAKTSIAQIDQLLLSLATLDQNIKSGYVNDKIGLDMYILKLVR